MKPSRLDQPQSGSIAGVQSGAMIYAEAIWAAPWPRFIPRRLPWDNAEPSNP